MPAFVVAGVLFGYPLGRDLYLSFTNYNGYTVTKFVGFANYSALFAQSAISTGFVFTLLYAAGTTVLVTVIAIPLAVALNKRFPARNVVRAALLLAGHPQRADPGPRLGLHPRADLLRGHQRAHRAPVRRRPGAVAVR